MLGDQAVMFGDMRACEVVQHKRQVEVQQVGQAVVNPFLQLRLDVHEIIQGAVEVWELPRLLVESGQVHILDFMK